MSLDSAYATANGGLANITRDLAIISQNVSNANTPDYATEVANQTSVVTDGGGGVAGAPTTREIDTELRAQVFQQNSLVAGLQTQQSALQAIDSVQGTPEAGNDLSTLVGRLQDAFSTLADDPSSQAQQSEVVTAAGALTRQINALSSAYGAARQSAQDNIVSQVAAVNTGLATIGTLSEQIIQLRASGQSTADLENQRDAAIDGVSNAIGARFLEQPDGDVLAVTSGGLTLPIHQASPLATAGATLGASASYPGGGIPAITLQGVDVTSQLTGGTLGAEIRLRDTTLPTFQAQLDQFSQTVASRFDAQGLTLFTDPSGQVPAAGGSPVQSNYLGFASTIQVNPSVAADPSLVRDGTSAVAGSATGAAAFTPNPSGGPAGFATLIDRVLAYSFGAQAQTGVAQPAVPVTGLGAEGTLVAGFSAPQDLADFATALVSTQSQASSAVTAGLGDEKAVQTSLQTRLSAGSAVSIDSELSTMVGLQNAYGANARVLSAVQSMWTQLIGSVTT